MFVLMRLGPPGTTSNDTLVPYTARFLAAEDVRCRRQMVEQEAGGLFRGGIDEVERAVRQFAAQRSVEHFLVIRKPARCPEPVEPLPVDEEHSPVRCPMQDIRAPDRAPVEIFAGGLEAAAGETWVPAQKRIGTGRADEAGAHAVMHLLPVIDEGEDQIGRAHV